MAMPSRLKLKVSPKGQITLPKKIRQDLKIFDYVYLAIDGEKATLEPTGLLDELNSIIAKEVKAEGYEGKEAETKIAESNLNFKKEGCFKSKIVQGDARDLSFIKDNSIDLICTHPPYANIIKYSNNINGDLSHCEIDEFLEEMAKVAAESYRVLKPNKYCAILMGDTRRKKHMFPLGFKVMEVFLSTGFVLKEIAIKEQHNCKASEFWYKKSIDYNFLLIAHEYLFVLLLQQEHTLRIQRSNQGHYRGHNQAGKSLGRL